MIDTFSILLSHGLLLLAFWRLLGRPDLDDESAPLPHSVAPVAKPSIESEALFPDA